MNKDQIRQAIADKYGKQAPFCEELGIKINVLTQHIESIINQENKLVSFYDKLGMCVVISPKSDSIFADYVKLVIAKKQHFLRSEMMAIGFSGLVTETMEYEKIPSISEASDVLISLAYICAGLDIRDIPVMNPENPDILGIAISILEQYKKSFYQPIDKHGIRVLLSAFFTNFLASCRETLCITLSDTIEFSTEKHNL